MKTIWKVLMGAAAVAAVAPYQVKKDEETGVVQIKAATWSGTYDKEHKNIDVSVHLLPAISKAKDCECEEDQCGCECCCEEEKPAEEEGEITIEVVEEPAGEESTPEETTEESPEGPKPQEA